MKKLSAVVLGLSLIGAAQADTITTTFPVSAEVKASCNAVTANALNFGEYDSISGSNKDATSTIDVTCTSGTSFSVYLNGGVNGSITDRRLKAANSSAQLSYNLFSDSARTTIWGDNNAGTPSTGTGTGSAVTQTVYGRINAGQNNAPIDTYHDTITVTVDY